MGSFFSQLQNSPTVLERTLGMPDGGPRCLPLPLDFAANAEWVLDYGNMQQRNFLNMVQSVWVDNSLNGSILAITVPGTNQVLKVPPNTQGYFPLIVPNPLKLVFDSAGGVLCQVILLNFPVAGFMWGFCNCPPTADAIGAAVAAAIGGGGPQ